MNTQPDYQKATLPIDTRVRDLLSRMTLPEKVGQMMQADAQQDLETIILRQFAGSILNAECRRVVEPGEFEVLVGPNSRDKALLRAKFCVVG